MHHTFRSNHTGTSITAVAKVSAICDNLCYRHHPAWIKQLFLSSRTIRHNPQAIRRRVSPCLVMREKLYKLFRSFGKTTLIIMQLSLTVELLYSSNNASKSLDSLFFSHQSVSYACYANYIPRYSWQCLYMSFI